jgi:putative ABC transport system ATP-binding protein
MDIFFNYCKIQKAGMLLVTHDEKLAYMCDDVYRLENRELMKVK